ncbi:MAG: threonine synthase [Proteobacteria bacterium]|nr:threonine synthase [Pseudomonadota bacterium]MBT6350331.1 threonine synthase [Pseudomonadota bacterium]
MNPYSAYQSTDAGLIARYGQYLPVPASARWISLNEGSTPLIRLYSLSDPNRGIEVFAKVEGANPTGSFKDRGMTVALTMAVHEGSDAVICASTGNTSAAAAAYAARAGIKAFVVIPDGKIALGKLAQAMMHGAKVIQITGDFDDGMDIVKSIPAEAPVTLVNSVNPFRLEGQKTAAFEIVDALGSAPDYHFLPVGNAGNISAYWMGYTEYYDSGKAATRPVMVGCQAAGAAPFVSGGPVSNPETVATAIRIGNPQSWELAQKAQEASGGWFLARDDEAILRTQKFLARSEGVFCEPASAVSVAGLITALEDGRIDDGATIVCTLTGQGLKDPDTAISQSPEPVRVAPTLSAVRDAILS